MQRSVICSLTRERSWTQGCILYVADILEDSYTNIFSKNMAKVVKYGLCSLKLIQHVVCENGTGYQLLGGSVMYSVCLFLENMTETFTLRTFLGVSSVLHALLKNKDKYCMLLDA